MTTGGKAKDYPNQTHTYILMILSPAMNFLNLAMGSKETFDLFLLALTVNLDLLLKLNPNTRNSNDIIPRVLSLTGE